MLLKNDTRAALRATHEKISAKLDSVAPLCAAVFMAMFVGLKYSVLALPLYWDEIVVYGFPAHHLLTEGMQHLHPYFREPLTLFFGHPPAYAFSLMLSYKIFGVSPFVARAFTLVLSCAGLVATYRLVALVARPWIGFLALLLLAFDQNYFVQSTQVLSDVAFMAFVPIVLYAAVREIPWLYAVTAIYLILTKETALTVIVAVPIARLLFQKRLSKKECFVYALPFLALLMFFVDEKIFTGKFSQWPAPKTNFIPHYTHYLGNLSHQWAVMVAGRAHRIILVGTILLSLLALGITRTWPASRHSWIIGAALLSGAFLLLGKGFFFEVNEHYFAPLGPSLVIGAVALAWPWMRSSVLLPTALAACFLYCVQIPRAFSLPAEPGPTGSCHEENMGYAEVIEVQKAAIDYIQEHFPHGKVHAAWPITSAIQFPFAGYVKDERPSVTGYESRDFTVLVLASASDSTVYRDQIKIIEEEKLVLVQEFALRSSWVRIYRKPD